jgi:hypothetical protein
MKTKVFLMMIVTVMGLSPVILAQNGNYGMMGGNMYHHRNMQGYMMDSTRVGNGNMMNYQGMMGNANRMYKQNMMNDYMGMPDLMGNARYMQMFTGIKPYLMTINMLPRMKEQLGLSNDQLSQMIDIRADYRRAMVDLDAKVQKMRLETQEMMDRKATPDDLEIQLANTAQTYSKMGLAAYDAAGKMKAVLNKDQSKQFDDLLNKCNSGNCQMGDSSNE